MIEIERILKSREHVDQYTLQRFLEIGRERIELMEEDTRIYHNSQNPFDLLLSNTFNPDLSNHNKLAYFSNIPMHGSNVAIDITRKGRVFNVNQLTRSDLLYLAGDSESLRDAARRAGFDGFSDLAAPGSNPSKYRELVIFPSSLDLVNGRIKPYRKNIIFERVS